MGSIKLHKKLQHSLPRQCLVSGPHRCCLCCAIVTASGQLSAQNHLAVQLLQVVLRISMTSEVPPRCLASALPKGFCAGQLSRKIRTDYAFWEAKDYTGLRRAAVKKQ